MDNFVKIYTLLLAPLMIITKCNAAIQVISDDDLMNLIRNDKYIVALFCKSQTKFNIFQIELAQKLDYLTAETAVGFKTLASKNCEPCDSFETQLEHLESDLTNSLNAITVKLINSQLTRLYSGGQTKEPVLVFFRHGIPLLYDGPPSRDLIFDRFEQNKEPIVKELTDDSFEHLTQAATGATTGDWFVMFYSPSCVDCHRLQARWEAVGAQLKSRLNIARVNIEVGGVETAERFRVETVPTFILFRRGKLYRYGIQKYDISSFVSFAQDWYKNVRAEKVPSPQSPFDKLLNISLIVIQEHSWLVFGGLGLTLITTLLVLLRSKSGQKKEQSKKKASKKE